MNLVHSSWTIEQILIVLNVEHLNCVCDFEKLCPFLIQFYLVYAGMRRQAKDLVSTDWCALEDFAESELKRSPNPGTIQKQRNHNCTRLRYFTLPFKEMASRMDEEEGNWANKQLRKCQHTISNRDASGVHRWLPPGRVRACLRGTRTGLFPFLQVLSHFVPR